MGSREAREAFVADRVNGILETFGIAYGVISKEAYKNTPLRVARFLSEYWQPIDWEDNNPLGTPFENEEGVDQMIVQTGIPFMALCEHHLLPFYGTASIGYVPKNKLVGLSKLARLTEAICHKAPSLQELITDEIATKLEHYLEPMGVIVMVHAMHTCMAIRGVEAMGTMTTTSAITGVFKEKDNPARMEFFELCKLQRS